MLVLSRKLHERIKVKVDGSVIWLKVVGIKRGSVRIAIDAPDDATIDREEIAMAKGLHYLELGGQG
jgi:carbon storage regulator CsrA